MPAPLHGQVPLSAVAQQIDPASSAASCKAYSFKAPQSNTSAAFIGGSGVTKANGYQLDPGDVVTYERLAQSGQPAYEQSPSDFFVVGTNPDVVAWLAFP